VNLHIKNGIRKVKICWFDSAKWFEASLFVKFAEPENTLGEPHEGEGRKQTPLIWVHRMGSPFLPKIS